MPRRACHLHCLFFVETGKPEKTSSLRLAFFSASSLAPTLSLTCSPKEKMQPKKTPPPKQPPRFLLFGGTGWIGGLLSELLTKEGATWLASKARLEDRALIQKEIEEVR